MTPKHLSDSAVQQYALDSAGCDETIIGHMKICEACRARAANYLLIFSEVKEQSQPVFDFDLAALVLSQLPAESLKPAKDNRFLYLIVIAATASLIAPCYLFRKYLLGLFSGALPAFLYLSLTIGIVLVIFQSMEMYGKYKARMRELNFY